MSGDTGTPPRRSLDPTAGQHWNPGAVQWVVKLSKFCNLRCKYCYEYESLGDRTRMSLDDLERMFATIASEYSGSSRRMDFVWHGGEPLLYRRRYYSAIDELQRAILGPADVRWSNSVQTNLTILNDEVLDLCRTFFSQVGVSVDLFGDLRRDRRGEPVQSRVLRNMDRLRDAGIRFGCITVLSRATAQHVDRIFKFFTDIDTSFRLLPIYRTAYAGQNDTLSLSAPEIVTALTTVCDLWFSSESPIEVYPLSDYLLGVVRHLNRPGIEVQYYDKRVAEVVYIVDTDGSLYSNADAYDSVLCHGNIFSEPFTVLRSSPGYSRALAGADSRMRVCGQCDLHGACSGYFMAEATPEQRWLDPSGELTCAVVEPVQRHMLRRLVEAGVVDTVTKTLDANRIDNAIRSAI